MSALRLPTEHTIIMYARGSARSPIQQKAEGFCWGQSGRKDACQWKLSYLFEIFHRTKTQLTPWASIPTSINCVDFAALSLPFHDVPSF